MHSIEGGDKNLKLKAEGKGLTEQGYKEGGNIISAAGEQYVFKIHAYIYCLSSSYIIQHSCA